MRKNWLRSLDIWRPSCRIWHRLIPLHRSQPPALPRTCKGSCPLPWRRWSLRSGIWTPRHTADRRRTCLRTWRLRRSVQWRSRTRCHRKRNSQLNRPRIWWKPGPISCLVTTKNKNTYIIIIVTSSQSSQDRSLFRQPSQPLRVENSGIQNSFEFRTPPFTTLHYCTFLFLPRYRLECHPRLRGRNPLCRGWRGLKRDVLISRTLKNQVLKAW